MNEMPSIHYVSWADPGGWKGAAFVEADSAPLAMKLAKDYEPKGNDVQSMAFRYDLLEDVPFVPEDARNRLLGREELVAIWPDAIDLMDYEDHV